MTTVRKSKKTHEELVDSIMEALPVRGLAPVDQIARTVSSSWETVSRWLRLIEYIQGLPRVTSTRVGKRPGALWSREMKKR